MAEPQFTQTQTVFSMTTAVTVDIAAPIDIVWNILTDARDYPRWNSTVAAIDGQIDDGERIQVHSPGTDRTFTPTISEVRPRKSMTWASGLPGMFRGVRTFELRALQDVNTRFIMQEHFSGVMFALAKNSLPDFKPIFEAFAGDLRDEAERIARQEEAAA